MSRCIDYAVKKRCLDYRLMSDLLSQEYFLNVSLSHFLFIESNPSVTFYFLKILN